ncbi:hypothetical protein PJP10_31965, partial [Mycobacterium kansasii]
AGVWEKLDSLYMKKSLGSHPYLKKRFYNLKMTVSDINEHMSTFNELLYKPTNVEVKIEDKDQVLLLLNSFPLSYKNLVDILIHNRDTI